MPTLEITEREGQILRGLLGQCVGFSTLRLFNKLKDYGGPEFVKIYKSLGEQIPDGICIPDVEPPKPTVVACVSSGTPIVTLWSDGGIDSPWSVRADDVKAKSSEPPEAKGLPVTGDVKATYMGANLSMDLRKFYGLESLRISPEGRPCSR